MAMANVHFNNWLDTFIEEKELDAEYTIEVEGASGMNYMPLAIVLDAIKSTSSYEQRQIKDTIVKIDFFNGDVMHFFKHLAQALAI